MTTASNRPAIHIEHLSKTFGRLKAVDDLSFSVGAGEVFGFVGPNGAGKTTTIRMLAGLMRPDAGKIQTAGSEVDDRRSMAGRIGLVPERSGFYGWMTALEYLAFFGSLYGLEGNELGARCDDLLRTVDLQARRDSVISTFSHGMRQRLSLARALVNRPAVLLMDEPAVGLDPQGQYDFKQLVLKLSREGITILISSHQLHELVEICSRLAVIKKGRLVAEGTLEELRANAGAPEAYRISMAAPCEMLRDAPFAESIRDCTELASTSRFVVDGDVGLANRLVDYLRARQIEVSELAEDKDVEAMFLRLIETAP